mgnify:FL=1
MELEFWKGKKVFITGHTGFKGSWLSLWLTSLGSEVSGFSLKPTDKKNLFSKTGLEHITETIYGNINDYESLRKAIDLSKPDILFHLAAQPLVRDSYIEPIETLQTNVIGTANILNISRSIETLKSVIIVTSDKCYENQELNIPFTEDQPLGGYDPYSASKGCAEIVTNSFRSSFYLDTDTKIASVRAGNVIGGGDWAKDRLIPDVIESIKNGKKIILRNPSSIRPWQHVLDPLSGYMLLAEKMISSDKDYDSAWNFGPDASDEKRVDWLVDQLILMSGKNISWEQDTTYSPHEAHYLRLDSTKAISLLGWQPKWDIKHAIKNTSLWYEQNYEGKDARDITLEQIQIYSES